MHQINIIVFSVNWTEKRKPIRIKERKTGNLIFVLWIHKKWLNDRITGCLWANNRSARIGQILYWTNPFLDKSSFGQIIFWTNPFLDKWNGFYTTFCLLVLRIHWKIFGPTWIFVISIFFGPRICYYFFYPGRGLISPSKFRKIALSL